MRELMELEYKAIELGAFLKRHGALEKFNEEFIRHRGRGAKVIDVLRDERFQWWISAAFPYSRSPEADYWRRISSMWVRQLFTSNKAE